MRKGLEVVLTGLKEMKDALVYIGKWSFDNRSRILLDGFKATRDALAAGATWYLLHEIGNIPLYESLPSPEAVGGLVLPLSWFKRSVYDHLPPIRYGL